MQVYTEAKYLALSLVGLNCSSLEVRVSLWLCSAFFVCFRGQLRIPSHISILHVEQEVIGDDTKAIDSVLECDTERERLLKREREINAEINNGWVKLSLKTSLLTQRPGYP